jgi:diguanylate cyclase (GGDEF)-like protein
VTRPRTPSQPEGAAVGVPGARARKLAPGTRVTLLTVALLAAGVAVALLVVPSLARPDSAVHLRWWMLVPAFALAETLVVHLELRNEAHTFTLVEVPLLLGLCFASPGDLILGRLLGEGLILALKVRQSPHKHAFNQSLFLAETALALTVFGLIDQGRSITSPWSWLAGIAAVSTANLLGTATVSTVIAWHGGERNTTQLLLGGAITLATNTTLALDAALLLSVSWPATTLVVAVIGVCFLAYRGSVALRQRFERLTALFEFTRLVNDTRDPEAVFEAMLVQTCELLRAEWAEITLFAGPDAEPLRRATHTPGPLPPVWRRAEEVPGEVAAAAASARRVVRAPRATRDPRLMAILRQLDAQDAMLTPLVADGHLVGVLTVADRTSDVSTFDDDDAQAFASLADAAGVALENGRLIERLDDEARQRAHDALHDALTGLPNRLHHTQRLSAALAAGRDGSVAVLIAGIDRFREINDTLGHTAGDAVLVEVARRFTTAVGAGAFLARLGADEFAVCVIAADDVHAVEVVGTALQRSLVEPIDVNGLQLQVTASVGIALSPDHGTDPVTLMQRADIAMYHAKDAQARVPVVYDPSRDLSSLRRLALAHDLRQAIDQRAITVAYQPKARLSDGIVVGVEALARWTHPEHGNVAPDEFIPLAERTGLIEDLTFAVLLQALEQQRQWRELGYDLVMAVNVSARVLLDADFPLKLRQAMSLTGASPARLTLELTESSVMDEPARVISLLGELSAFGITISIDDFGTGYSSLAYLQQLPARELKIDKSFVFPIATNEGAASIVRSVIDLARNLGLKVVAEGIEDQAAWDVLRDMGCDIAQGYFLSKPVAGELLSPWLAERARTIGAVLLLSA